MSRHQTIGFLSPFLGGYYFGGVLNGVQRVVQQHGFRLIAIQRSLEILGAPQDIRLHSLASDQIDGWIVVLNTAGIQEIAQQGMPIVTISALIPGLACPAVFPDNCGGTQAAVRHLLDHGHERIAFVGYMENDDIQQRYAGYQAALAERGLPVDQQLVFATTDALELGGRAAAQRMLEAGLPCTAIVAGTDLNGLGVMEVMRGAGYRIPEDLAFAGFDDIEAAQYVTPPLTTICQRFDAIGNRAAELLLAQLAGQEVPAEITYVPTDLIIRRSCGCRGVRESTVAPHADVCRTREWGERLVSELVRLVYPALPTSAMPSAQIWPGAAALVHGLAAAIEGDGLPAPRYDEAWQGAVALTSDIEALLAILKLLERTGIHCWPGCRATRLRGRGSKPFLIRPIWR